MATNETVEKEFSEESFEIEGHYPSEDEEGHISDFGNQDDSQDTSNERLRQRSVAYALNKIENWCKSVGLNPNLDDYDNAGLARTLCRFFTEARNTNSTKSCKQEPCYSYNTLRYIFGGLRRYFTCSRFVNISVDRDFKELQAVMLNYAKLAKTCIYSKESSTSSSISPTDLRMLYESSAFNTNDPKGLSNKVWFEVNLHFFTKKSPKLAQRNMSPSSFAVGEEEGRRFIYICNPILLAEIDGRDTTSDLQYRMYERVGDPNCPVYSFLKYISKRNPNSEAFYQWPENMDRSFFDRSPVWYSHRAYGQNILGSRMPMISQEAGLSVLYYNSAIRATRKMLLTAYHGKNLADALAAALVEDEEISGFIKAETQLESPSRTVAIRDGPMGTTSNISADMNARGSKVSSSAQGNASFCHYGATEQPMPGNCLEVYRSVDVEVPDQVDDKEESEWLADTQTQNGVFDEMRKNISAKLPSDWILFSREQNLIKILHVSREEHPVIRKELCVFPDRTYSIFIHKAALPSDHLLLSLFPSPLNQASDVINLIHAIDRLNICSGITDKAVVECYNMEISDEDDLAGGKVEYADGITSDGVPYYVAVRSIQCQYLTNTYACIQCSVLKEKISK